MIRGLRGAITIELDKPELVWDETARLVREVVAANHVEIDDIASIVISTTPDITSAFPARAVRCMHEMDVPGALPLCIRVLIHANVEMAQKDVQHIYLNDAVKLRPDLAQAK